MAAAIRSKGTNVFVWILMAMLVIGLTGFGFSSLSGAGTQSIGAVGDEEVSMNDYARALSTELRRLSAQVGQNISLEQAQLFGVGAQVMNNVMTVAALNGEARRLGISVGDETVRAELLANPAFQGLDGAFDKSAYEFALLQTNLTPSEYDNFVRTDKSRRLLQVAVAGGILPSETLAVALLDFTQEGRSFTWATLDASAVAGDIPDPTDDELSVFYDANPAMFTAPQTRNITYIHLSPDMLINSIPQDEEALRGLYADRASIYTQPERRLVERLAFASTEEAQAALDKLNAGEMTFEELTESRGLSVADIDLGAIDQTALSKDAGIAVFELAEPAVAGPVQSSLGPAIFRVNAILDAQETSFEDAREELQTVYAADRARRMVADSVGEIDDLLAAGAELEEIAAETDMVSGKFAFTSQSEDGLAAYDTFRIEAAAATAGDFAEVHDLSDGGIFALRLDDVVEPTLLPLADVRDDAVAGWRAAETLRQLGVMGEALRERLAAGESFEDLGLTPRTETGVTREVFVETAPPTMMFEVFSLELAGTVLIESESGVVLAQLDDVVSFESGTDENKPLVESIRAQLGLQTAQDIFQAYTSAIQEEAGVTTDQAAINAVHSQFN